MTIAGSDSGGGAGIQADLKTFQALGVYGASTLTAITAQNTVGVTAVHEVPTEVIAAQIDAVLTDIGVDAAKTGMLSSAEIISTVAERVRHWNIQKLVVDPVMVAKSGDRLLREDAVHALIRELLPLAMVLTPNVPEAEVLVGHSVASEQELRDAARAIVDLGAKAVIMKGGHRSEEDAVDLLFDGATFTEFRSERFHTLNTHGTGCTFSAAIAAGLARGLALESAVGEAKRYLSEAIRRSGPLGAGHGPVAHDWPLSRQPLND
jgi:hydroxymethylpyrimidine/phosphomethylpyrimidine kinase